MFKRSRLKGAAVGAMVFLVLLPLRPLEAQDFSQVVEQSGVRAGLAVVLGGDGSLAAGLWRQGRFVIEVLDSEAEAVARLRQQFGGKGLYGAGLSAARNPIDRLPYVDGLVNLLVVADPAWAGLPAGETARVLRPGGALWCGPEAAAKFKAALGETQEFDLTEKGGALVARKRRPAGMDDWTHFRHGPDRVPVSQDQLAGPPFRTQWIADPKTNYGGHYFGQGVIAGGRLFYGDYIRGGAMNGAPHFLIRALDAHNGLLLWKRTDPADDRYYTDGRSREAAGYLVADEKSLYNIALGKGCQVLDAETGEVKATHHLPAHPGAAWHYVACCEGRLLGLVAPGPGREVLCLMDAATGKVQWTRNGGIPPATLCVSDGKVLFLQQENIVALDLQTGKEVWSRPHGVKVGDISLARFYDLSGICRDGRYVIAGSYPGKAGKTAAFSTQDGRLLWEIEEISRNGGPAGVLMKEGLVWNRHETYGHNRIRVFDPATGKAAQTISTYIQRCTTHTALRDWFCYDNLSLYNVKTGESFMYSPLRGNCYTGFLHGSGLTYCLPSDCQCNQSVKGIMSLAPAGAWKPANPEGSLAGRLEKGPAFGRPASAAAPDARGREWPCDRHDNQRSGITPEGVVLPLDRLWEARTEGMPTGPVVANGLVFVGTDGHSVQCWDANDGRPKWTYAAEGAVPAAPTAHEDLLLFGSEAGWATCLQAGTGELVWRFRAAPEDRRMMYYRRLVSPWRIASGVVVEEGVAYLCAGRVMVDGAFLYALRPRTGEVVWKHDAVLDFQDRSAGAKRYKTPEHITYTGYAWRQAEGGISPEGVLAASEQGLYIPTGWGSPVVFDRKSGKRDGRFTQTGGGNRLLLTGRWLVSQKDPVEDEYGCTWERGGHYSFADIAARWGRRVKVEAGPGTPAPIIPPSDSVHGQKAGPGLAYAGPLLLAGDQAYGAIWRTDGSDITSSTFVEEVAKQATVTFKVNWVQRAPMKVRAAVLAGEVLFCAGDKLPGDKDEKEKGLLWAVSKADGRKVGEWPLPAGVVTDGLAVATGRVFAATRDGRVVCFSKAGK